MIPDYLGEFIRSMQARIKHHEEMLSEYRSCKAYSMASTREALIKELEQTIVDLHKLQAKILLGRTEEENEAAYGASEQEEEEKNKNIQGT